MEWLQNNVGDVFIYAYILILAWYMDTLLRWLNRHMSQEVVGLLKLWGTFSLVFFIITFNMLQAKASVSTLELLLFLTPILFQIYCYLKLKRLLEEQTSAQVEGGPGIRRGQDS